MAKLERLPFQLVQADNYLIYDDFIAAPRPRLQATFVQPALTANASLATKAFYTADRAIRIDSVQILPDGSSAGIDNADTSVWTVKNGASTVASKTYNGTTTFPATHVQDSLGTITSPVVAAGGYLTLAITNGTTAATPATVVSVGYTDLSALGDWMIAAPNHGNAALGDAVNGVVTLTPSGGTPAQNDETYLYSPNAVFEPASAHPVYAECLLQYTEANTNNANVAFGIASSPGAGLIASGNVGMRNSGTIVAIYKVGGASTWSVISQNGANVTTTASTLTAGGSAYQKLQLEVLDVIAGNATVVFKVDGELLRDNVNNFVIKHNLVLAGDSLCNLFVGVKNGSSTMETLLVDYLAAVQLR